MDNKKLLGKRIKELRNANNLTQEQLSEKIDRERKSISNMERGLHYPSADCILKLAEALKVSPSELFAFEHLDTPRVLIKEMDDAMIKDEKLTRLMYKFFKTVK